MNREDITRMAREAGGLPDPMVFIGAYERFAALVAAHEREMCAELCDEYDGWIAKLIRARGEQK